MNLSEGTDQLAALSLFPADKLAVNSLLATPRCARGMLLRAVNLNRSTAKTMASKESETNFRTRSSSLKVRRKRKGT